VNAGTLVGEIVPGHDPFRLLAVGGMGEVYLARHQALGVVRAIKVIRADLRGRDKSLQRFTREAQVLARLQHNSIVQIIEFGSLANGSPFLAMEYIEGPSLDDLVENGPLPITNALVVLEQMAHALHHAHSNNVIHRDLKPANILVRSGDVRQVKIIDFGLARVIDGAGERLTGDRQLIGAPAYMAPEQAEGTSDPTSAVDIYSLASIGYLLVSGTPPFVHKKAVRLMAAHVQDVPPRLSERCPEIPAFLDELLFRCLAKDPADRPTAAEVAAQLGQHLRETLPESQTLSIRPDIAPRASETTERGGVELVASPWGGGSVAREISAQCFDHPLPRDPDGRGVVLATTIMSLVEEIATYLSKSDPELTSLLRSEARIYEQLASYERELAGVSARLEETPGVAELETQRDGLREHMRTLEAQQLPLQRRMVQIVATYQWYATGAMKALFRQMELALQELERLRQQYP
jgi:serine/threonine protein kinase